MKNQNHTLLALCLGAVLQATTFAQLPPPAAPKPPVGVARDAKLFNGKWYKVVFEKVSWHAARDKCRSAGGQLAVIPDEATWIFTRNLSPARLWIGATDEKVEGVWMWVDGTPATFTVWHWGEPNNSGGNEHYAVMEKHYWNDTPKEAHTTVGYICEWKAK